MKFPRLPRSLPRLPTAIDADLMIAPGRVRGIRSKIPMHAWEIIMVDQNSRHWPHFSGNQKDCLSEYY